MNQSSQSMSQLQKSNLGNKNKSSLLLETFSDYGLEAILIELIDFVLTEYPDQIHCAVLSAYLIPTKNYVAVLNTRQNFRLETNYPDFTNVEDDND
jgi:hypothetical protein